MVVVVTLVVVVAVVVVTLVVVALVVEVVVWHSIFESKNKLIISVTARLRDMSSLLKIFDEKAIESKKDFK